MGKTLRIFKTLGWATAGTVLLLGAARALFQAHERTLHVGLAIDVNEPWQIGGVAQWVRIRGRESSKPLLFWIHGGPGFPQTPFAAADRALEKDFIVIHWEQRGAGRTFREDHYAPNMRLEQFVGDAREVLARALRRFDRSKAVVVGHSWGSLVGALLSSRNPEMVSAYVGVGQIVSFQASENYRFGQALATAQRLSNNNAIEDLRSVGPPPHRDMNHCKVIDKWFARLVPRRVPSISRWEFVSLAFTCPDYSWLDLVAIPRGVNFSAKTLWREIYYDIDLSRQASKFDLPIHIIAGEGDFVAPISVVEKYLASLESGHHRELHRFEHSTHWPFLEEPTRFCATLVEIAAQAR